MDFQTIVDEWKQDEPVDYWGDPMKENGIVLDSFSNPARHSVDIMTCEGYVRLWEQFLLVVRLWEDVGWVPTFNISSLGVVRGSDQRAHSFVLTRDGGVGSVAVE